MIGVSQVFAQQLADRRAARCVGPLSQARIEIELGGDAVECHEKGETINLVGELAFSGRIERLRITGVLREFDLHNPA